MPTRFKHSKKFNRRLVVLTTNPYHEYVQRYLATRRCGIRVSVRIMRLQKNRRRGVSWNKDGIYTLIKCLHCENDYPAQSPP